MAVKQYVIKGQYAILQDSIKRLGDSIGKGHVVEAEKDELQEAVEIGV